MPPGFQSASDGSPRELTAEELAGLAAGGDAGAWEIIILRHRDVVFDFHLRKTGNRHDADDFTQLTFKAARGARLASRLIARPRRSRGRTAHGAFTDPHQFIQALTIIRTLMATERERMLAGRFYNPLDPELVAARTRCRQRCQALARLAPDAAAERRQLLAELFGTSTDVWLEPPFHCDYGTNISLGRGVFFNFNCVILDVTPVRIGSHTLFGPAVQIYTAMHPLDATQRREGLEYGKPVSIGADVWVGGGAIICPGVTIADRAVIGAGSVVTSDVPADAFVAGNPARLMRVAA